MMMSLLILNIRIYVYDVCLDFMFLYIPIVIEYDKPIYSLQVRRGCRIFSNRHVQV